MAAEPGAGGHSPPVTGHHALPPPPTLTPVDREHTVFGKINSLLLINP